jgi:putative MFS transporter
MEQVGSTTGPVSQPSVAARLERIPFSGFHRNFLLMVAAGEWVETMMLLGNGVLLALIAAVLHFSPLVASYVVPVAFFAGEFVGSISLGYLSDLLGRRTIFAFDLLIFGGAMIVAAFFSNPVPIAIFIFIAGLGVGGEFPLVDSYTSEVFPGQQRGRRMATLYTLAVIAAPIVAGLAYLVSHPSPGPFSWRIVFWIIGVLALIVWLVRLALPESPRWLEVRGRQAEAGQVVAEMERQAMKEHGLTELPAPLHEANVEERKASWLDIWARDLRGRTVMMLVFQFFQSGIFYGFTSLAPTFLLHKGIGLVHSLGFTMLIYLGFFVGSICNIFIIDRVERKWGIVTTAILSGILGTLFVTVANVAVTIALGFLVTFTLWNFSNFLHTYQAEIFPTRVRSTAAGTTYSVSRISTSIIVAVLTAVVLPHGLLATYGVIWIFIAIVAVNISLFGPLTSRRPLETIIQ